VVFFNLPRHPLTDLAERLKIMQKLIDEFVSHVERYLRCNGLAKLFEPASVEHAKHASSRDEEISQFVEPGRELAKLLDDKGEDPKDLYLLLAHATNAGSDLNDRPQAVADCWPHVKAQLDFMRAGHSVTELQIHPIPQDLPCPARDAVRTVSGLTPVNLPMLLCDLKVIVDSMRQLARDCQESIEYTVLLAEKPLDELTLADLTQHWCDSEWDNMRTSLHRASVMLENGNVDLLDCKPSVIQWLKPVWRTVKEFSDAMVTDRLKPEWTPGTPDPDWSFWAETYGRMLQGSIRCIEHDLAQDEGRVSPQPLNDNSSDNAGWVLVSTLDWPDEYRDNRKKRKFLKDHSAEIKHRHPGGRKNRHEVYAADWLSFWAREREKATQSAEGPILEPLFKDGVKSRYMAVRAEKEKKERPRQ
jgi:hypothetical protein